MGNGITRLSADLETSRKRSVSLEDELEKAKSQIISINVR